MQQGPDRKPTGVLSTDLIRPRGERASKETIDRFLALEDLPGPGPAATLALLLPLTYALPPVSSFIMLAGIYYGAQYGGSTTAILLKIPGEASSVVTAIDGYEMARQGRAGTTLATDAGQARCAFSSFRNRDGSDEHPGG